MYAAVGSPAEDDTGPVGPPLDGAAPNGDEAAPLVGAAGPAGVVGSADGVRPGVLPEP